MTWLLKIIHRACLEQLHVHSAELHLLSEPPCVGTAGSTVICSVTALRQQDVRFQCHELKLTFGRSARSSVAPSIQNKVCAHMRGFKEYVRALDPEPVI